MLSARAFAEPRIKWLVGKGEIDASKNKWYSSNNLSLHEALQIKFLFNLDGSPNTQMINDYLGVEAISEIHNNGIIISNDIDLCYWDKSCSGALSLSFAC